MQNDTIFHLLTASEARQKGIRQKIACPSCGRPTFVPYVSDKDGTAIDDNECGRCDRESNCNYHLPPADYFSKHPERRADFFGMQDSYRPQYKAYRPYTPKNQQKQPSKPSEPTKTIISLPDAAKPLVRKMMDADLNGTFMQYLSRYIPADRLKAVLKRYGIGRTRSGATIWWQIDDAGQLRDGKIMAYQNNGHRDKSVPPTWAHIMLERLNDTQGSPLWSKEHPQTTKCLFGQHLLAVPQYRNQRVIIVESEKNALIGHLVMPQYLWLATGSKGNFKSDMLQCLAGRDVWALPDADAFDEWTRKADTINKPKVQIWDMIERLATPEMREKGADIADLILAELESGTPFDTLVQAFAPAASASKDTRHTENTITTDTPSSQQQPTVAEPASTTRQEQIQEVPPELLYMLNSYPDIQELINAFDLTDAQVKPCKK